MKFAGRYREREPAVGLSVFNFEKQDEDTAFELVDNKPVKKPTMGAARRPQPQQRWGQPNREQQPTRGTATAARGKTPSGVSRGQQQMRQPWRDQQRASYTSSVDIRPDWHVVGDHIAFTALSKLSTHAPPHEEITSVGVLSSYDRTADRITPKYPAKLRRSAHRTRSSTASEDPILRRIANDPSKKKTERSVYITDALLTTLMCVTRSVYPWDIVITRHGDQLWFDKRPNSSLDFLTNGETAPDSLPEEKDNVNGMQQLSVEATAINQGFREQMLSTDIAPVKLEESIPHDMSSPAQSGYRYREWSFGDVSIVVRCEVDAVIKGGDGSVQYAAIHALNEFDPKWAGVDWRTKLENQRGAVLATEVKNNANKIAKWTAAALIGGIDIIKLGYVSRATLKNSSNHVLLGTQAVKPRDFAAQMNLSMENCWGIVKGLIDFCFQNFEQDGTLSLN